MSETTHDNPGVIAPPPLIYAGGLVLGFLLNRVWPLAVGQSESLRLPAVLLILLSAIPGPLALLEMYRHRTSPMPEHPTTAIVTSGPFRYTRNPIYLTFTLFFGGVALLLNNLWMLLLLPVVLLLMTIGVIEREERYLERKFGDEYRRYRERVRRWI